MHPDVASAYKIFFAEIFYQIIMGILKAESSEVEFADLRVPIRRLTESQVRALAELASEFYVTNANPKVQGDKKAIHSLKRRALEYGLKRLSE